MKRIHMSLLLILLSLSAHLERSNGTILKAFFAPHDNLVDLLCERINKEEEEISIMVYYLTDPYIINTLKHAIKRNIKVTIVVDYWWTVKNKKKIERSLENLPVKACKPLKGGVMHHKFVLFKCNEHHKPLLWNGSFNLSKRSQQSNDENIIICDDNNLFLQYQSIFNENLNRAVPLQDVTYKPKTKKESTKIKVTTIKKAARDLSSTSGSILN
jgi:phosphatidylserine/phosphatidylglycerophosphate/cardiolipin synthase-like enzyme